MHAADFLRHRLGWTGTHVGCEQGVCGMCTILVDGAAIKSCLMLAVQLDGTDVQTVESLAEDDRLTTRKTPSSGTTRCNAATARRAS
ncbi:Caffeine dehydrogenase subunit gamma [Geodia barretti]|uniref:Caffeine dehydrogenase subunit gamma n=1 Tax=Geodia barretti TaxID=519541 RepID=A0AA35R7Y0_GEOBA|nr:Caffeine dehydrogenase subunit gamma [Geodia barretti]